jgi:hypothetical protein
MKKIIITAITGIYIFSSTAIAEIGVNVGISGSAGLFAASGNEVMDSQTHKASGSEHGAAAFGSIFIEKTLGDRLAIGIDYVPQSLETDQVESRRQDHATATDDNTSSSKENKVQIDFEDLTTAYLSLNVTENAYIKAGIVMVDVITNESLATGSTYNNTDLDGTVFAIGYNKSFDNTMFLRAEGSYMNFDGASLTSSTGQNVINLTSLDGVTGKISIGKSF